MRYDVISFDLIRACLAIPVGSGLYSASFGRSTEPRKRVSAHAETIPIAQHHCPPWVAAGLIGHPAQLGGKRTLLGLSTNADTVVTWLQCPSGSLRALAIFIRWSRDPGTIESRKFVTFAAYKSRSRRRFQNIGEII